MEYSSNKNTEITTAIGKEGLGEQSWWVQQWMELINSYRFKKRLERAWSYAREGNVTSIRFEGRRVHARVQGTEDEPYKVKLWLDVLDDEDWEYVLEAMSQKARWSAQLLAGIMPKDIESAFAASGRRLFPFKLEEIKSECSCPDKANPCKHISAVYFLMGDRFKEDPFVLFQLRGRNKNKLLHDLAKKRSKILKDIARKDLTKKTGKGEEVKNSKEVSNQSNQAFSNPELWWQYKANLDSDLVIITPALEGEDGLSLAKDLPLARNPKFMDSHKIFSESLIEHIRLMAQQSMIKAMDYKN